VWKNVLYAISFQFRRFTDPYRRPGHSVCFWEIQSVSERFSLYLGGSVCIWEVQSVSGRFGLYLGDLVCIWEIRSASGRFGLYLGDSVCIWEIWSVSGRFGLYLGHVEKQLFAVTKRWSTFTNNITVSNCYSHSENCIGNVIQWDQEIFLIFFWGS